jgi:hypothetical protein
MFVHHKSIAFFEFTKQFVKILSIQYRIRRLSEFQDCYKCCVGGGKMVKLIISSCKSLISAVFQCFDHFLGVGL